MTPAGSSISRRDQKRGGAAAPGRQARGGARARSLVSPLVGAAPSSAGCCSSRSMRVYMCARRSLRSHVRRASIALCGGLAVGRGGVASICARVLIMLSRAAHAGIASRLSSVWCVVARDVRACECSSLAGAYVFGRRRSCLSRRVARRRAAAPAAWWASYARASMCGLLVASRPPGDLENATHTQPIPLGLPPVS